MTNRLHLVFSPQRLLTAYVLFGIEASAGACLRGSTVLAHSMFYLELRLLRVHASAARQRLLTACFIWN